jgi:hypothetical protein
MHGGGFFGGGYGGGGGLPAGYGSNRRFEEQYHCYSVAYAGKSHLEVRTSSCVVLFLITVECNVS